MHLMAELCSECSNDVELNIYFEDGCDEPKGNEHIKSVHSPVVPTLVV